MDGGEWAERERAVPAAEEKNINQKMEEKRENDISGDGGEEERPSGAPQFAVAPTESDDRWMLR